MTNGVFLKKGENVFYLNGKDQTFPYRMILKVTFFEPEKIDVYKRQGIYMKLGDLMSMFSLNANDSQSMGPVSYTHLDVYKRQQYV